MTRVINLEMVVNGGKVSSYCLIVKGLTLTLTACSHGHLTETSETSIVACTILGLLKYVAQNIITVHCNCYMAFSIVDIHNLEQKNFTTCRLIESCLPQNFWL